MKISEITLDTIKDYINAPEESHTVIQMLLNASKQFVKSRTGLNDDEMDKYEDLTIAVLCLCSDMYDRRQFTNDTTSGTNVNPVVDSILGMYSYNLI